MICEQTNQQYPEETKRANNSNPYTDASRSISPSGSLFEQPLCPPDERSKEPPSNEIDPFSYGGSGIFSDKINSLLS